MVNESTTIDYLLFYVNGKQVIERHPEPDWTLLWYLRNKLNLTGSKLGCGEGGCGACTVFVSRCIDSKSGELEHRTINGCLTLLCSADGCHVITVEGLGSTNKSNLHPIQSRLAELSASQCGFCTPGMVMSLYGTVMSKKDSSLTLQDIEESFDGNLCRCTGYRPILDAAKTFACDFDRLPKEKPSKLTSTTLDKCLRYAKGSDSPPNQIEFPAKLKEYTPQTIHIKGSSIEWFRPISLQELLHLRQMYSGDASKLVFGNTRVQIETKFEHRNYSRLISVTHVKELQQLDQTTDGLIFGAGVTFTRLHAKLIEWNEEKINDGGFCRALLNQMKYFASTQIRNVASIGGNIVEASPISDINPVLLAAGAILEFHRANSDKARNMPLQDFYLGHHRVSMNDDEVLVAIRIPFPDPSNKCFIQAFKQARRRDDSKGIVSAGFQIELKQSDTNSNQWCIVSAIFAFGGMASSTILAKNTQQELIGRLWTKETIDRACQLALKEMPLDELSPGGQAEYRHTLVQSFLLKFYFHVCSELRRPLVDSIDQSAAYPYHRPVSHGQQTIPERPSSQKVVGSSIPHRSAYLHTTGEATYTDDIPSLINTLHGAFVLSTQPNARIKHIDIEDASKVPGFVSYVSHVDVPGSNKTGAIVHDEEIFVSSITPCIGAIIGLVVAETEQIARMAANLVHIEYELLSPTIFTIEDAIAHHSYLADEQCLQQGDVEKALANAEHKLKGTVMIGGQEHFYMEPNSFLVIPSTDDKEVSLHFGTQTPSGAQEHIALALGRDASHITCHVKRVGGGFGGKEARAICLCAAVAVAAVKLNRSVRLNMERHADISVTGQRHPYRIDYQVGFTSEGRLSALDIRMWNNGGCSTDMSNAVMSMSMIHMTNCYQCSNIRIRGNVCKTHTTSNTAFRGFGGPQAMLATETIIEHIAAYLKFDPLTIRRLNLYKEGDFTHYGQQLDQWNVPRLLDKLIISSDFKQRQKNVEEFNRANKYRKRGITIVPNKFSIGFVIPILNQAGALVLIYKDGSVVVNHGGAELGQGLHTKMIVIAAEVLRCDIDHIRISETSTDKVPNTSVTAGSNSSDINGMAVQLACKQLRERLDTLLVGDNVNLSWKDLIQAAYFARIDLSAHGFYKAPGKFELNFAENRAHSSYFTQGAAVTEVELDTLTGDWHLLRVDVLMDLGRSLSPQIDIGQIEGAFMQGIGLYTMEELIWGDHKQHKWAKPGALFTCGPDTYKIPSFSDVPLDMRISFLSDVENPKTVYSSKGIGEPPFLLAASVFFALKQACMAYRQQQGFSEYFQLYSPATVERLRMACVDEFTNRACRVEHQTFQPKASY